MGPGELHLGRPNLGVWDNKLRDRVVILEDSDGDGRQDKRTVFWDQGCKATSVEVGFGGVWVLNLPHLLFIPDRERDDVPDGPPIVMLDGLDEQSVGHTPANGLKWGPDGWLYARHGIQGTSSIGRPGTGDSQRVKINTGIWRYHPGHGTVEAVMHGMTNSWGFDYDEHGEMFVINTVIGHLWHLVPGAHVKRMYGTDLDPHTYGLIEQTADHVHWAAGESWGDVAKGITDRTSTAGGGHAHIGLMIYQGDNWPAEYRNKIFTLNLHGQRLNSDILVRKDAGYTARHGDDICFLSDPWYRGMDLITGPDGGVFIADWSDTGECHDHDGVHRNSGRIYKLSYGTPPKLARFDLRSTTTNTSLTFKSARMPGGRVKHDASFKSATLGNVVRDASDAAGTAKLQQRRPAADADRLATHDSETSSRQARSGATAAPALGGACSRHAGRLRPQAAVPRHRRRARAHMAVAFGWGPL